MQIYSYKNKLDNNINFAITKGKLNPNKDIPVRVLSTQIKNKNILLIILKFKKSLNSLSKYKNFLLLIINKNNKLGNNNIIQYFKILWYWCSNNKRFKSKKHDINFKKKKKNNWP